MKRSAPGFTVVELLITLVIMAILLTLGVVGFRGVQANAADAERQSDIETIARGLEQYYNNGNPYYTAGNTKGSYPGTNMVISIEGSGWCDTAYFKTPSQAAQYSVCRDYWSEALPGVSQAALTPPGFDYRQLYNPWMVSEASPIQIINPSITQALNEGKYVYKPLNSTNEGLCYSDTECRRYVLLYKKETTGEVVIKKSRHQQ